MTRWHAIVAIFLSLVLLTGVNVVYTNHTARESETKWCALIITLDDAYLQSPPATDAGKQFAQHIRQLRDALDCPNEER